MRQLTQGMVLVSAIMLFACSGDDDSTPPETQGTGWATVNGTELSEEQLDFALNRFFGNQFIDARAERKVRESLIASRAIALRAESELDEQVLDDVELAVQAYREERLIAAYIENTTTPEPVSSQMVNDYYQANPEEFGAQTIIRLAVLEADVEKSGQPVSQLSQELNALAQATDWADIQLPEYIRYYRTSTNAQLPASILAGVSNVKTGERSGVIVGDDRLYQFRKVSVEQIPPKPLAEVSATIRKRLAATQLSKTVKALSDRIVGESDVVKNY